MFDEDSRNSLVFLLPNAVSEALVRVKDILENETEAEIAAKIDHTVALEELRVSFWREYEEAQKRTRLMKLVRIYDQVMSASTFYKTLRNDYEIAYVFTPFRRTEVVLTVMHNKAIGEVMKIMDAPIYMTIKNKNGEEKQVLDRSTARLKFEVFKYLTDQKFGMAAQKNININIEEKAEELPTDIKQIEAELRELSNE